MKSFLVFCARTALLSIPGSLLLIVALRYAPAHPLAFLLLLLCLVGGVIAVNRSKEG